jgi:hypothetical protein
MDLRGRIAAFFDGTQGWILSALVGFLTAILAYLVDVSEAPVFDWKEGYCSTGFFTSEKVSSYQVFIFLAQFLGLHGLFSTHGAIYKEVRLLSREKQIPLLHKFLYLTSGIRAAHLDLNADLGDNIIHKQDKL